MHDETIITVFDGDMNKPIDGTVIDFVATTGKLHQRLTVTVGLDRNSGRLMLHVRSNDGLLVKPEGGSGLHIIADDFRATHMKDEGSRRVESMARAISKAAS